MKVISKSGEDTRAVVRFGLPTVPAGCVLQSATLRLYASAGADGRTLQALRLASSWTETAVTWNNQPGTTGAAATTPSNAGAGHRSWDVTAQIAAMDASTNHGFLIRDAVEGNGGSEHQFHSKEKSDNQPQIVYRFAPVAGSAVNCGSAQTVGSNGDAWVDQGSPSTNKGGDTVLKILSKGPANNTRGLVRFGLPAIPSGCAVESATLRLHINALATDRTIEAWRVAGRTGARAASTGATSPARPATPPRRGPATAPAPRPAGASGTCRRTSSRCTRAQNNGFLIRDAGENNGGAEQQFSSRENASNRPELVVRFAAPDTRAPATTIDTGPTGNVTSTSATFTFSANEANVTFQCSLDDAAFTACTSPKAYTNLTLGAHTLKVRATDLAGNVDGSPASRSWTVEAPADLAPPDTTIADKPANPSPNRAPSFSFTGADDATPSFQLTFECRLDTQPFAPCTSPKSYSSLLHGSHTFEVRAKDLTGKVDASPATYTWMLDTFPPDTTINTGPTGTTTNTSETFTFSSDEPSATFQCSLDGAAWLACASPHTVTGLTAGARQFQVRALDAAGNADLSPATRNWTANISTCTAQTITVDSVSDSWVLESSPANNFAGDSIAKVDSKSGGNARALFKFNLPAIPAGCDVVGATLRLYASSYKDGRTLQAIALGATWTEAGVNWGNQPLTSGTAATTASGFGYRQWTVTTQVQAMYLPGANHGFLIRDSSESGGGFDQGFHTREKGSDNPPQLVIQFD